MAAPYQDSPPPSLPSDHFSDHLFFPTTSQASSSSSSSLSVPLYSDHLQQLQLKQQGGVIIRCNGDNNDPTVGNDRQESGLRFTIWKQVGKSESSSCMNNDSTVKSWASSKMRLVINSDQTEAAAQTIHGGRTLNDGGVVIRTCSDCNTTKTPLWRSGPRGPKSLCNACGIRQRKARRAMMAAAEAAANGGAEPAVLKANKVMKRAAVAGNLPQTLKRKCKEVAASAARGGRKKLRLSESAGAYQRVFAQDEREAAILLMALSYGCQLLHG